MNNKSVVNSRSRGRRRSRSQSRSREKIRSRSRSPLHKRERKKRCGWDIIPDNNAIKDLQESQIAATCQLMSKAGLPVEDVAAAVAAAQALMPGRTLSLMDIQKLKQQTIHSRRIYVGNVMPYMTEHGLRIFFNEQIQKVPLRADPTVEPVANVSITHPKMFAFVEFNCIEDCDISMCMDGLKYMETALRIRSPKDYARPAHLPPPKKWHIPGVVSTQVANDGNKLFLANLPTDLTDFQIREFVSTFGPVKSFSLARDLETNISKGYAFFAYADPSITDKACAGLNGIMLGGKEISCQRGISNSVDFDVTGNNVLNLDVIPEVASVGLFLESQDPSCVLVLQNMVDDDELQIEKESIINDVWEWAVNYGNLISLQISGERIFLEYDDIISAGKAHQDMNGRKFANRIVLAMFTDDKML